MDDQPNKNDVRYELFLSELAVDGNVTRSAKIAGIERGCVYDKREREPEFAKRWADAIDAFADTLEKEAFRRAVLGVEKPIAYQGQFTYVMERDKNGKVLYDLTDEGETDKDGNPKLTRTPRYKLDENGQPQVVAIREFSDSLLTILLKAKRPKEYRDNAKIELGNAPGETFKTETTPTQAARTIAFALAMGLRNVANGEDLG